MADLSITAGSVVAGTGATRRDGIAGATITQGQVLYIDSENNNVLKLADANSTGDALIVAGIALNAGSTGQPIKYVTLDEELVIGATLVVGQAYMLSSATPGGIAPISDAAAGDYVTVLGVGASTTELNFNPTAAGAVKV